MNNASSLRVAAIQMVSHVPQSEVKLPHAIAHNINTVSRLVAEAATAGTQLIILPENCLTFGCKKIFTLEEQAHWLNTMSVLAARNNLWLIAGSLPLHSFEYTEGDSVAAIQWRQPQKNEKPFAASVVFNGAGKLVGVYRKMHLFDVNVQDKTGTYRESDSFQPGMQPEVIATPWGIMGLAVCYDLRFPEYFRRLRELGAEFIVVPSAFTYSTGAAHWEILIRARAIETQCFVIGVNQGGTHDEKRQTWGDSMIVDPWGVVVTRAGKVLPVDDSQLGECIVIADIRVNDVQSIRERMPLLDHRRI
ncbi:carbon-nitrogen hydrolase family protein [Teredinibacter purpureus]|uniref:carbon-nitrogen hydrolase family protein n=1 Tax=Teredinibacter purpureus TaxID=2731756 RepID=UPI0009E536E9|nr:carbon-nitrogen hydrolase family protein [Teredinibacter purpureus]